MTEPSPFIRVIQRREVLLLSFGAMIGWGWVLLTGTWISRAGTMGAITAFAFAGLEVLLVSLVYAELVTAMPKAGGEHVYTYRALGRKASFICTWCLIMAYLTIPTFEAVALPQAMQYLIPNIQQGYLWQFAGGEVYLLPAVIGAAAAVLVTVVNIRGIALTALVQSVASVVILLIGLSLVMGTLENGSTTNMQPLFRDGIGGVFSVLILVPMMFIGFDVIPQSAEEIDLPPAQIGKLLVLSVMMALAWYALMILGVGMNLSPEQRELSTMATADANAAAWGSPLMGKILVLGGIAGIMTSWIAFVLGCSRAIYAMAASGMLPAFLAEIHPRYHTPHNAILAIGALSVIAPFFGSSLLIWLVNAGGFMFVITNCLVCWAFLRLRRTEPELERPFRVRHGKLVATTALVLALALLLVFMPGSPGALSWPHEWFMLLLWSGLGIVVWYRVARKVSAPPAEPN
ncbi:amino acid permease [Halieaceae bacterium IMCC14734]|uniref:Amino acid permease n=1 Tax=Candidatus Litorirhabdus singularis TaxID=2518993 RepID=A0ABT3TD79_9GAMM|nr:amino acid permease [Candidatus Litorirhabdus singularis]MCX2980258.1 amino acid permease [Candidatus Litorirhabdus singularis]